jgi:hypothetical protein
MHSYYNLILQKPLHVFRAMMVHHQEVFCGIQAIWNSESEKATARSC